MTVMEGRGTAPTSSMMLLAGLLEQRTGQQLAPNRAWRLEATLTPMLRERGHASLDELVVELIGARDGALADRVVEALLNGETFFYRDAGVIDLAVSALEQRSRQASAGRLRIWSAGCSTGQEPLSLAMLLAERKIGGDTFPEILATDISDASLARARSGRFTQFEIQRGLPIRRMIEWFEASADGWVARPELLGRVHFRRHNLMSDAPPAGGFDLILCRNVMLYFAPAQRRQVFDRLASALRPGGLLVLGAGETVIGQTELFQPSPDWRGFYELAGERAVLRRSA